jgi:transcriptional regulator with XRE-family HTH domain
MRNPQDSAIGQKIAMARKAAGLTQRELSARLGWPPSTLGNYEEGRRSLHVVHLIAIAAALQQSPAALLVDLPEARAIINRLDGDLERCLQVAFVLDSLDSAPP